MTMKWYWWWYLLFIMYIGKSNCTIQCLNENGSPVDWFVIYKFPRIRNHSNNNVASGRAYAYITSNSVHNGWKLSEYNITDNKSIMGQTLSVVYNKNEESNGVHDDILWLLYNDQPPVGVNILPNEGQGHTKGIVLGNQNGGIWIVHSVPHYPNFNGTYSYPETGCMYGQSLLCISLDKKNLESVGNQLIVNMAYVYGYNFDGTLRDQFPTLYQSAIRKRTSTVSNEIQLTTLNNVTFQSYAKNRKFNADLYGSWLSKSLETELNVETWLHDANPLPPYCNITYKVHNIKKLNMEFEGISFKNFQDHSKYAISKNVHRPYVCIGDINRDLAQMHRGGGTVCIENKLLWLSYDRIISSTDTCPERRKLIK